MKILCKVNKVKFPHVVFNNLIELQPELDFLLTNTPKFGIASLEVHFIDGVIKRIIRKKE